MYEAELRVLCLNEAEDDNIDKDGIFIKKRNKLVTLLKSFNRSQAAKRGWGAHRYKFMSAIKAFHRSSAGRKLHRKLGRFLSTKDFHQKDGIFIPREERKSITSMLREQLEFYVSPLEQAEIEMLLEAFVKE